MADQPIVEVVEKRPRARDRDAITRLLDAYNQTRKGAVQDKPDFAVLVRDPVTKDVVGGLYGVDGYGWAFVRYLAIDERYRGHGLGTRLIDEAEKIARARGYIGVWLDTFEFQARPFYEKLGYELFGELEGGPNAIPRYFLKKLF